MSSRAPFSVSLGTIATNSIIAVVGAVLATTVAAFVWSKSDTTPMEEGFGGIAAPDHLRTTSELAEIVGFFSGRTDTTEDGPEDLREMTLLCSKLSAFKKDIVGVARVVNATASLPYTTAHDIESVAETTARCLSKTIPERDLNLIIDKWGSRGEVLLRRLCTEYELNPTENKRLVGLFKGAINDLANLVKGQCFASPMEEQGRALGGYESPALKDLGTYKGYF
jgi:hypothetical protein